MRRGSLRDLLDKKLLSSWKDRLAVAIGKPRVLGPFTVLWPWGAVREEVSSACSRLHFLAGWAADCLFFMPLSTLWTISVFQSPWGATWAQRRIGL